MDAHDDDLPGLDVVTLDDEDDLWVAIDRVVQISASSDERLAERREQLLDLQRALRKAVDAETWQLVMDVEAVTNELREEALVAVARWAFAEGLKTGRAS